MELVSEVMQPVRALDWPGTLACNDPNTKSSAEGNFKLEETLIANIVSSGIVLN